MAFSLLIIHFNHFHNGIRIREEKKRPPNIRLYIPGDENYKIVIQEKLQIVKNYLTRTLKKPGIVTF